MIVEDNQQMRRLMVSLIDDLAAEIIECGDGSEAIPAYHKHRPDWVFMDIEMARVDGLEATRRIVSAFPDAQVVMVTTYDDAQVRMAATSAGACRYVLKDSLLEIRKILTG
jgi:CheY-like chemotaxis protein